MTCGETGADRSLRRNAVDDTAVVELQQRVDDGPAHARMAPRERCDLQGDHDPDDRLVEQRPGSRRVRQDERALQFGEPRVVDPRSRQQSKARVDAVDGGVRFDDLRNGRRSRIDGSACPRVDTEHVRP